MPMMEGMMQSLLSKAGIYILPNNTPGESTYAVNCFVGTEDLNTIKKKSRKCVCSDANRSRMIVILKSYK